MFVLEMARKIDQELADALGATPPSALRTVGVEDMEHLTDSIYAALENQQTAMNEAEEQALKHVPWPLRSTVRRILGSER